MNREDLDQSGQIESFQSTHLETRKAASTSFAASVELQLHYEVAMPEPEAHLFEVCFRVTGWQQHNGALLDLKMPVWTPGSYLVREYARHLQDFAVTDDRTNSPLPWCKLSKNHWQIETQGHESLTVRYRIYADELSVRTNHLDGTHGYFNGAALFCYIPGYEQTPLQITIVPPTG